MHRVYIGGAVLAGALVLAYVFAVPREYALMAIPAPSPAKEAVVLFAGDMMFDRTMRQYAETYGGDYLFSCIDQTLTSADLVVANLEGPITSTSSKSVGTVPGGEGNFTFTFPTSTAALLEKHNIRVVNLGNNHIENFGNAGVESTMQWLSDAGVHYFGDPLQHTLLREDVAGVPLSFINYNEFLPPHIGTASSALAEIRAEVAAGRKPIVYTHWGIEYATSAPSYVIDLAHQFIDAGAVAVIGSHPHVVEQSESYKGAPIYYSLGNFIFDQYFSKEVMNGLMVELTFNQNGSIGTHEIPVVLGHDRRVCPVQ